ncbi:AsmA family protein [Sphingomonas sp. RB3P16]|uniref:AsmA family protein n=1 Tax=Parasphingomonas frigoris TaxID=3096163 RepID=UPI002FCB2AF8
MSDIAAAEPAVEVPEPRSRRRWLIARNVVLGIVAVLFAIWLVLYITKGRFLKPTFERISGSLTHRAVKVQGDFQLFFDPFQIKFLAEGLTISNPSWASKPNLFEAKKIDTRIAPLSLLFGKRRFYWLDLADGAVDLEWSPDHSTNSWTFSQEKGGKRLEFPTIDRATLAGTTVRYRDTRMRLLADLKFDTIKSSAAKIGEQVDFTGTGTVRETPFTLTGALLSPDATVARGANKLTLTARAAHNVIDVDGTLPSLAEIEKVPLAVKARGRNMQELLHIIGVTIPQSRTYALKAQLVKTGDTYAFTRMSGHFGDSDLTGRFTVENKLPKIYIDAKLASKKVDIIDLAPFIGYNPDLVATKGVQAAAAATGAAPARLLPDASLDIAALHAFDADLKWTIGVVRSKNVPVSNIDLTLALKDSVLKLSPLTMSMARGNVASDIVLDARQRPTKASYDIRLASTPMGRLLAGFGVAEAGTTGTIKGRLQLAGSGDSLHDSLANSNGRIALVMPAGSFWTRNVQLAELDIGTFVQKMFQDKLKEPVRINCGLIGFTVRKGVAAADPILIDTSKNVIAGTGGFSFGTESLDLAFRADGKKFSLFSAQSPIGLQGSFAGPKINPISPQLLSRAGAGLGLALLATPPAALIAFVDVGDAKAAACGPILAARPAAAQKTTKGKARDDVGDGSAKIEVSKKKKFLGIF